MGEPDEKLEEAAGGGPQGQMSASLHVCSGSPLLMPLKDCL